MFTKDIKIEHQFLVKIRNEVKRTSFPPRYSIVLLAVLGIISFTLLEFAIHFNSTKLYILTAFSMIPLFIVAVMLFLYICRKWGRKELSALLGLSFEHGADVTIYSWCLAYNHLDRCVLNAVEPRIFKLIENNIDRIEITETMKMSLSHEIYRNWNRSEYVELCDKLLKSYSIAGNLKDYNGLKLCTNNFKVSFPNNKQLTLKVQADRDMILQTWERNLKSSF